MTGFMLYQKLNGKWRDDKMSDKYQNTELIPEERAAYLLEELSLDEKVAQLNCVFPFDKASYDFAGINEQTKHGIGQVREWKVWMKWSGGRERCRESLWKTVRTVFRQFFIWKDSVEHLFRIPQAFLPELEGVPDGIQSWRRKLQKL